jgi:hypothetical protein
MTASRLPEPASQEEAAGAASAVQLGLIVSPTLVGGALGAALESDAAVREAAYAHLPEE